MKALNNPGASAIAGDISMFDLEKIGLWFDRIPLGLAIFNEDLTLEGCNCTWADFLALYSSTSTNQIVPGVNLLDLITETKNTLKILFEQVLVGESTRQFTLQLECENATSYWDLSLASFTETGTVKVMGVVSDVTRCSSEHENLEDQWRKSQLYHQTRNLAILQERDRLSRELHDSIAQSLGYLNLQISNTNRLLVRGQINEAQQNLEKLKQLADETYIDLREEIFSLRTNRFPEAEFLDILQDYLAKYRTYYGLKVEVLFDDPFLPEFAVDVSSQVLRIIQEALINVRKHAQVNEAKIRFTREDDKIRISIEDSGQGFDMEKMSQNGFNYGLQIMQERVTSIGGRLEVISAPAKGSRLIVWVPVQAKN